MTKDLEDSVVKIGASLTEQFTLLADPRVEHPIDKKLIDIIKIAIYAVICSTETWTDLELFVKYLCRGCKLASFYYFLIPEVIGHVDFPSGVR